MSEISENQKYKDFIKAEFGDKDDDFCPLRYERQMDYLFSFLKKDFAKKNLKVLDACCGYGRLIHFLNILDPNQNYIGIDYVDDLINKGKKQFIDHLNIDFELGDLMQISSKYDKYFDITIKEPLNNRS